MKRILLLLMLVAAMLPVCAETYSSRQKELISGIERYLESKGFEVERQSDGLRFKEDGIKYYVEVSPEDNSPMFVRIARYVKFDDNLTREKVMERLVELNNTVGVKAFCKEKNVIFAADVFVRSTDDFKYVFPDLFHVVKVASKFE